MASLAIIEDLHVLEHTGTCFGTSAVGFVVNENEVTWKTRHRSFPALVSA
jgi:hypothetical protein